MPWEALLKDGWHIASMNHIIINNQVHLFCAMQKEGKGIMSSGVNESQVFDDLAEQAGI